MILPPDVTVVRDPGGRSALRLERGEDAVIVSCTGAQVLSWHREGRDVLWTASQPEYAPEKPVRGGIPVVFPWFGDHTDDALPAHGFARTLEWTLSEAAPDTSITLSCGDNEKTRTLWPHAFGMSLRIALDDGLLLTWTIENTGPTAWSCEQALHTYYSVGDIHSASLEGLEGVSWTEHARAPEPEWDPDAPIRFRAETDRVFQGVPPVLRILAPALRRTIEITAAEARSCIVWNPWPEKTARLSQMAPDDWERFVCVESANVKERAIRIEPGERHVFSMRIRTLGHA